MVFLGGILRRMARRGTIPANRCQKSRNAPSPAFAAHGGDSASVRLTESNNRALAIANRFGGIGQALSTPIYRTFWASNATYSTGRWMYRVAMGWLTWELTGSTSWLGLVGFADTFPTAIVSIAGGVIADRVGFLRVIRLSQLAGAIFLAVFAALALSGTITVEMIVVLAALIGSSDALSAPSRLSIVHSLVPRQHLTSAIALGSATFNASRFVGPAIAGLMIQFFDLGLVLVISAVLVGQFVVVLSTIQVATPPSAAGPKVNPLRDFMEGVRYVLRFLVILLCVVALFVRPYIDLMAGISTLLFGHGADGQSLLLSATGLGGLLAGMVLAQRGRTLGLTGYVVSSLVLGCVALIAFVYSREIWLGACFSVLIGFFILVGGISTQTLIQNAVESRMRGRVMSIFIVAGFGLPAIGSLSMGWIASVVGLRETLAGSAVAAILIWLCVRPAGRRYAPALEEPHAQSE